MVVYQGLAGGGLGKMLFKGTARNKNVDPEANVQPMILVSNTVL